MRRDPNSNPNQILDWTLAGSGLWAAPFLNNPQFFWFNVWLFKPYHVFPPLLDGVRHCPQCTCALASLLGNMNVSKWYLMPPRSGMRALGWHRCHWVHWPLPPRSGWNRLSLGMVFSSGIWFRGHPVHEPWTEKAFISLCPSLMKKSTCVVMYFSSNRTSFLHMQKCYNIITLLKKSLDVL